MVHITHPFTPDIETLRQTVPAYSSPKDMCFVMLRLLDHSHSYLHQQITKRESIHYTWDMSLQPVVTETSQQTRGLVGKRQMLRTATARLSHSLQFRVWVTSGQTHYFFLLMFLHLQAKWFDQSLTLYNYTNVKRNKIITQHIDRFFHIRFFSFSSSFAFCFGKIFRLWL